MAHLFAIKYPETKILIAVRNPVKRLPSNFLFFIGDEQKKSTDKYSNINVYLQYIMEHPLLKGPFDIINEGLSMINTMKPGDGGYDTLWSRISMQYNGLLVNVTRVCRENFVEMGFANKKIGSICTVKIEKRA